MELSDIELRILGCLVEKEATTPDNYPLSSNALTNACNQKSNREPVTAYSEGQIDGVVLELRQKGLARTQTGGRTNKHKHVLDEAWAVSREELAILAVMALRGPQTVGELRTRTERYEAVDSNDISRVLDQLRARSEPFVKQLPREPGQKEPRWRHLLGDRSGAASAAPAAAAMPTAPVRSASAPAPAAAAQAPVDVPPALPKAASAPSAEVAQLQADVRELKRQVQKLYELLGERPE